MSDKTGSAQIGVMGLAVMGSNLARNFARNGFTAVAITTGLRQDRGAARRARPRALRAVGVRRGLRRLAGAAAPDHDHGQGRAGRPTP